MKQNNILNLLIISFTLFIPANAMAYIGPGAGVSAIGTVIALVGAILLALIGFLWYPIKRYFFTKKNKNGGDFKSK